jgi:hypothetical protein
VYQRVDASKPNYSPNYGYEGGVYLRFIVEHYDDLPDHMAFIQADLPPHGEWLGWVRCVKPDTAYLNLNGFCSIRDVRYWAGHGETPDDVGFDLFVEACWRDLLATFDITVAPLDPMAVEFPAFASFVVSRAQLQKHPKSMYEKALELVGGPRCHRGPLELDKLINFRRKCPGGPGDPACADLVQKWQAKAADPNREDSRRNKDAGAGAFEHLNHVIIGGGSFAYGNENDRFCQKTLPRSQCPGSPCHA